MLKCMFFINWELVHCEECKKACVHANKKHQNPAEPPQLTYKNGTTCMLVQKCFKPWKTQKVWGFVELPMDKLIHIEAEHGPEANIVVLHSHLDFFCKSWNKDTLIKESITNLLNKHTTKTRCALRCKRRLWNKKRNICYLLIEMSFENNCRMPKWQ